MKKGTKITIFVSIALLIGLLVGSLASAFSGSGAGTEGDPYVITTPAQLLEINDSLHDYYDVGNDLDFTGINILEPIGNWDTWVQNYPELCFSGVLDGNDYTISNLILNSSIQNLKYDPALFGCLTDNGTAGRGIIKNLAFDNVIVDASSGDDTFIIGYPYSGHLDSLTFTDITLYGSGWHSIISYPEYEATVTNIVVDGVDYQGTQVAYGGVLATQTQWATYENITMININANATQGVNCFVSAPFDVTKNSTWKNMYCQGNLTSVDRAGLFPYPNVGIVAENVFFAVQLDAPTKNVCNQLSNKVYATNVYYDIDLAGTGLSSTGCDAQNKTTSEMMEEATFSGFDSGGGTRYVVDENGNVVGVQQNNQVIFLEEQTSEPPAEASRKNNTTTTIIIVAAVLVGIAILFNRTPKTRRKK
jgi:hypothetical protein